MDATDAELLAAVEGSPRAVAAHDRDAWVGLFAPDGAVEDPVGSRPHVGPDAIGPFYDTFIAPNEIVFRVDQDVVSGSTVVRDLIVETTMSTGVTMHIPMHLRYDLDRVDGELKIRRLRAHWELPTMIAQLLGTGVAGWRAGAKLGSLLLSNLGLGGAMGFSRGFLRAGTAGKRMVVAVLEAASRGGTATLQQLVQPGAVLEWPAGTTVAVEALIERAAGVKVGKTIAAGRFVTVSVDSADGPGVVEVELARGNRQIAAVRAFIGA